MKLSEAIAILKESGVDSARHDARELFSSIGGFSISRMLTEDVECDSYELVSAIERRASREPLQYIVGKTYFYNEEYETAPACLIPRQDTELLVDYAVKHLPSGKSFVDLCTGSGCVGVSVLKNTVGTTAVMADISPEALAVAKRNAERNGVFNRAEFLLCDVTESRVTDKCFAVLSNPPYVSEVAYASLEREIFYEPRIAFVGGADGGDFYRKLVPIYKSVIESDGFIAFEIGYDQGALLRGIAEDNAMICEILRDFSGNDRVAVLRNM